MDSICTACLCKGRKLYFIGETGSYHLYSQILNEIPVYDLSHVCVRVCWECRALLHRFGEFKAQVKSSYSQLLHHLHQNVPPSKDQLVRPSRLRVSHITSIEYPTLVKLELEMVESSTTDVDLKREPAEPNKCDDTLEDFSVDNCIVSDSAVKKEDDAQPQIKSDDDEIVQKTNSKKVAKVRKKKTKSKLKGKKSEPKKKTKKIIESDTEETRDISEEFSDMDCDNVATDSNDDVGIEEEKRTKDSGPKKEMKRRKEPIANGQAAEKAIEKVMEKAIETVGDKPKCPECGKLFSSKKTYRYHMNTLHKGQNRYPCPRCGKVYQWKSNLGRHMRSHKAVDSGELYCAACDKRFASVATYRQHLRISRSHVTENEFSFECNECGKKFVSKTKLRDHVDWEHLQKVKFRCQLCNKAFKCHTSLYVHLQNVHRNKSKENLCHICGKSYQNAAKLKYHIVAMHTSETPYRCSQCRAAFGWYSSLYRHVREVHHKVKHQPKKIKKGKRDGLMAPPHQPMPPFAPPQLLELEIM